MTKEHILAEIRRTAEENGGVPVGFQRFETETGIGTSGWRGRYWARWGDALVEAGFERNAFSVAIPADKLLAKLAALMKELGRFPVDAEIKLKRRTDSTFPSHQPFRRFGGRVALAAALRRYLVSKGDDELAALCPIPTSKAVAEYDAATDAQHGFVYLMKSGWHHTIGRTNAVGRRQYEHNRKLPDEAKLLHEIKTDDPVGIEAYWHRRFAERRGNGEWFDLTAADVAAFKRRKFM